MIPTDLRRWPIFNLLESKLISQIHMTIVFGDMGNNALIVTKNGMVYGIGSNTDGCLGTGDTHSTLVPKRVDALCQKNIRTFACGKSFVLALTEKGEIYLWGYNGRESIHPSQHLTPNLVSSSIGKVVIDIACGRCHFLALTNDGQVYVWDPNSKSTPKEVNLDTKIAHISCGDSFSTVVTDNGEVYSWSLNGSDKLENESSKDQSQPYKISLFGVVIEKVVCGYMHTLALSYEGALYTWGANSHGQLGFGPSKVCMPKKLEVQEMGKVLDIAASHRNNISVAMGKANRIFIWGQCLGQTIAVPTLTPFRCLHDAFCYASPSVMHKPLILCDEETSLMDSMKKAFDDATTSDLIIRVHGKLIHVHKAVLKMRCHYFRTMFQEQWTENSQKIIEHEQFSYDVYKSFLKYLYTNEVELLPENALELLELAEAYSEGPLKWHCVQMIKQKITVTNVAFFYSTSIKYNSKELEEYCFKFALNYMTEVIQTASFYELDERLVKIFVIKAAQAGAFRT